LPAAALRGVRLKARVVRGLRVWVIGRVRVDSAGCTKTRKSARIELVVWARIVIK
jgi:hypothetical protein